MPNIKSQKDRVVQAANEQAHNKAIKTNLKTVVKKANAAIDANAADKDATVLAAVSAIDNAPVPCGAGAFVVPGGQFWSRLLASSANTTPHTRLAVMPPAAAPMPPVRQPNRPFSATAFFTPVASR